MPNALASLPSARERRLSFATPVMESRRVSLRARRRSRCLVTKTDGLRPLGLMMISTSAATAAFFEAMTFLAAAGFGAGWAFLTGATFFATTAFLMGADFLAGTAFLVATFLADAGADFLAAGFAGFLAG